MSVPREPDVLRHYGYRYFLSSVVPILQERFNLLSLNYIFYNKANKHLFTIGGTPIANVMAILEQVGQGMGVSRNDLFTDMMLIGKTRVYGSYVSNITEHIHDQIRLEEMESQIEGEGEDPTALLNSATMNVNTNAENPEPLNMNEDPMNGGRRRRRQSRRRQSRRRRRRQSRR
jgi:hypothetical protein